MHTHQDLMAQPPETRLPEDPAEAELAQGANPHEVVRRHPASPTAWAALAEAAESADADAVEVYAFARVGYHRSLDLLRRNGWKGHGPVPYDHQANRGFHRCLALLARKAKEIGETEEWDRCSMFLYDSSPDAYSALLAAYDK